MGSILIWCHSHPTELVVGVCPLCLNEKLLVLASNQSSSHSHSHSHVNVTPTNKASAAYTNVPPKRVLPWNLFDFTTFFNRLEIKQHKSEVYYHTSSSTSTPEDSFISIKFEENGAASWDKDKITNMHPHDDQQSKISWDESWDEDKKMKSVIEHARPMRWRKRIGDLFQHIRWKKRSSKSNVYQVGTKLGGKVKNGWIRALTRRRTKQ